MMEHTTDRLFWTLSSIIIAALLLTLGVKIFPKATSEVIHPMSGVVQSADKSTSAVDQAISGANADKLDWQTGTNGGVGNVSSGSDDTARDQAINNQITKQNQALQSYQGQLNDAVNHINDLNSRLVSLQNDKTGANNTKDINDLKSQINDANGQIKNYQSQISSLNDQITQLKNSQQNTNTTASSNSGLIQQLQQNVNSLNQQTQGISDYQSQITSNASQIQSLINQVNSLQSSGNGNTSDITHLKNQIANLASQLNTTNTQLAQAITNAQTAQSTSTNNSALINNLQNQTATLQSHDIYNITSINDSTNLATLTTPGTYVYNLGSAGIGITNLQGADASMQLALNGFASNAWDNGNATLVVSPRMGTWQTQTLIGANGITLIRSMSNGQNFDPSLDPRCKWHVLSGNDTNTLSYKGNITGQDYNNITTTGIYTSNGTPGPNTAPINDWFRTLTVINNNSGIITQTETTQDAGTPTKQTTWQRIYDGRWEQWTRIANDTDLSNINNQLSNTIQYKGTLANGTSFNNIQGYGIYELNNQPFGNFPYAYYGGNGLTLESISDGVNGRQLVWSTGDGNTPQLSYRVQTNGSWGRWISVASIDDVNKVNNNGLTFKGLAWGPFSSMNQTGIYDLSGQTFADGAYGNGKYWGQITIMNTGGVLTQTLHLNYGDVYSREVNSWGTTAWQRLNN